MSQTNNIVLALKRALKSKGISYQVLAKRIGVSEASVKRIFSERTFTLQRLEAICDALDIRISQIAKMGDEANVTGVTVLSEKQETEFHKSEALLKVFYALLEGADREKLMQEFDFPTELVENCILKLDRLGLLRLEVDGRFRLKVSRQVRWLPSGPLMKKYGESLTTHFFRYPFDKEFELIRLVPGRLSRSSSYRLMKRLLGVLKEYEELQQFDEEFSKEELSPVAVVLGFRPWESLLLSKHKKKHK